MNNKQNTNTTSFTIMRIFVLICVGVLIFFFVGRLSGKASFDATITKIENGLVTVEVTKDGADFMSEKLPEVITFDLSDADDIELEVGKSVSGFYVTKSRDGNHFEVDKLKIK